MEGDAYIHHNMSASTAQKPYKYKCTPLDHHGARVQCEEAPEQSFPSGFITHLGLDSTPLHALPRTLLALLLKELALLFCAQTSQLRVSLFLLQLIGSYFPLLGLFLVVCLLDPGDLLVAGLADAAQGFRTEVRRGDEMVGHAEEVGEDWEGRVVVGGEFKREVYPLAGLGVVETGVNC